MTNDEVRTAEALRQLQNASTKHVPDDDLHARGEDIQQAGTPIDLPQETGGSTRKLAEVLAAAFERMDARAEGRDKPIATPWPDFNEQLPGGGFWPGCHVLVSGTGAGKSTWALQLALHAARNGAAVVYAGLELEDEQIALRLAGDIAGVGWSDLYTGQAGASDRNKARLTAGTLGKLPFYLEAGDPMGWAASRMQAVAEQTRKEHPTGPVLIVVDFLQLIGSEPDAGRQDLRERIGKAAYVARHVAKTQGATVLLISSVARNHYETVADIEGLKSAGIDADMSGSIVTERFMYRPDAIVGLGKESGEIEFSADSVTAAIALPKEKGASDKRVVFATAKLRAGRPAWCSLLFTGYAFKPDPTHGKAVIDAMRTAKDSKTNGKKTSPHETEDYGL